MALALTVLGFWFSLFPYTQIIEIGSYNQPYALAFSVMASIASLGLLTRRFPRYDFVLLMGLIGVGTTVFLVTVAEYTYSQNLKYLLIYLSPIFFCLTSFALSYSRPVLADRILVVAAGIWLFVGMVQLAINPTFLAGLIGEFESVSTDALQSGRGVVGLAPEPTHYGFHLLVIAAGLAVIRQRFWLPLACVLGSLLIARSSSALLAIVLGGVLYLLIYTRRARILLIGIVPAYFIVQMIVMSDIFPESLRIISLLRAFFEDPTILVTEDASINARVGGAYVGLHEIVTSFGVPHGMSATDWLNQTNRILSEHPWLYDISTGGIPSGILVVIYQTGWFGLILMVVMLRRMFGQVKPPFSSYMICVIFFVFMSQYYISTPGFGLLYGLILARMVRSAESAQRPIALLSDMRAAPAPA